MMVLGKYDVIALLLEPMIINDIELRAPHV
jgi:hypothetical protein